MIQIVEGAKIIINCDQEVTFFINLDGSLTMYNIVNGIEYALVIPSVGKQNQFALDIDCKLFEVGTN